jgi:CRP-like cAMP-binding protein
VSDRGADAPASPPALHVLLARKLRSYDTLGEREIGAIQQAIEGTKSFATGQDLVSEGDRPAYSSVLIEGWAARSKTLENGASQITSIHVPGDFVDLHGFLLHKMDHSVVALSPCRIAKLSHERLLWITDEYPHLTRLLWLNTLIDAAIHRNWIVGMGRLPAAGHLAQLICEIYVRLKAVALASDCEFEFPLSQAVMADALGLSPVHVNRTIRELRERNLISLRARVLKILDWDKIVAFSQFDPTYLSQFQEPR